MNQAIEALNEAYQDAAAKVAEFESMTVLDFILYRFLSFLDSGDAA